MATKLNWFLRLKNLASSDPVAKDLLDLINNAETPESKQDAKDSAKAYVESLPVVEEEPTQQPEPEPQPEPETPVVSDDGEIEIETESDEPVGDRPEPQPAISPLAAKIARRKQMTEEAIAKRRNQPITLSEQKKAAIEKGKEVMKRNAERAEQRKALHEMIEKQMAERQARDVKNMSGVLSNVLRELRLNIRLEVICKRYGYTHQDLEKLRENNPAGWQQCKELRPLIDKEMELFK